MQWILLILAFIIPLIASLNVKATFKKYSNVRCARGLTGAEAAAVHMLRLCHVPILFLY